MIHIKKALFRIALFSLLMTACEMEKTEYQEILDDHFFQGFSKDYFIIHKQSISYYSPEVHDIYPNLYAHQNGNQFGNGIHSFAATGRTGLMSFQDDNYIEFLDLVNLTSEGTLDIENPRNIFDLIGTYYLVSYGQKGMGGIAIIDRLEKSIESIVHTDINVGKVYREEDFLYIFSDGSVAEDTIIEKYFYSQNSPSSLLKVDSFAFETCPVDFVEMEILIDEFIHQGLAILCKGNSLTPPSIVIFDLVTEEVVSTYPFESTDIEVKNLSWLEEDHSGNEILVSNINEKLYSLNLSLPVESSVLIDKNISQLIPSDNYFLSVSRDTMTSESYFYRIDRETLELLDSISISPGAIEIKGRGY